MPSAKKSRVKSDPSNIRNFPRGRDEKAEVRRNHGRRRFGEAVSVYRNPVVSEFEIVPTWRIDSRPVDFLVSGLADVSLNTISKLLEDAGGFCASFNDVKVRGVKAKRVQVDEAWSFTYAKQKNVAGAKAAPDGADALGHPGAPASPNRGRF